MILDTIAQANRERYREIKRSVPLEIVRQRAQQMNPRTGFPFEKALKKSGITYICEVKKASPSKGVIASDFPYLQIAKDYEKAGAGAISVLTEPRWFMGKDSYLEEIAGSVKIPVLRKDFTVDEYQIYQAKLLNASAVLLICAILDEDTIRRWIEICDSLGLSALVEAHTEEEVCTALNAGARIIGVNNRNLQDFTVDLDTCVRLRSFVPRDRIFVAESGIKDGADIEVLRQAGADAVLIGEALMRAQDKAKALRELNGGNLYE